MTTRNARFKRSALAVVYLCCCAITYGPAGVGVLERFASNIHRAFWCAALEFTVIWPIYLVTSEHNRLGILGIILPSLFHFCGLELSWWRYRRWVQLFVVQGSLSPFPTGTPTLLGDLSSYAAVAQGNSYCCNILIVGDINTGLKTLRRKVEPQADAVLTTIEPLFEHDSEDLPGALLDRLFYIYLAGQGLLYRFLPPFFTTMGTYLERMAIGACVTGCINAYNHTDPTWRSRIFAAGAIVIPTTMVAYLLAQVREAWDEKEARLRMQQLNQTLIARARAREGHQDVMGLEGEEFRRWMADKLVERGLREASEAFYAAAARGHGDIRRLIRIRTAARIRALDEWEEAEAAATGNARVLRPLPQRLLLRLLRIRSWLPELPDLHEILTWAFQDAWLMRFAWLAVELAHLGLPPWRWLARRRWLCPEFAAMWSDDARRDFYASVLAGEQVPAHPVAFLMRERVLRQSDYEDMWRRAGLTTDVVLDGGEAAADGILWNLYKWDPATLFASPLVRGLEMALGVCLVAAVATVAKYHIHYYRNTATPSRLR